MYHADSGGSSDRSTSEPPWWRELNRYHAWVFAVAVLGWLFDTFDQRIFVVARTPALRDLLSGQSPESVAQYAGYATSIFIVGWATGGLIFGLMGDRWGRTRTMVITILIYSAFTGLSSIARSWGEFALYRFLCGMGVGGEYAAGVALIAEVMPPRARLYALGMLQSVGAFGNISASAISVWIGPESTIAGIAGWRWLFLVGALPAVVVVLVRSKLREPDAWLHARTQAQTARAPGSDGSPSDAEHQLGDLREIFRDRRWRYHLVFGMLIGLVGQAGLWGIGFWTPELIRSALAIEDRQAEKLEKRDVPNEEARELAQRRRSDRYVGVGTLLQDVGGFLGTVAFTLVTARLGRRKAFGLSFFLAFLATGFVFSSLRTPSDVLWMVPLLGFFNSGMFGGYAIYFPELFPTRLRSTGTGFCYNVARYLTALGPIALGQLVLVYEQSGYENPLRPAAITLSLIYIVGIVAAFFAPETHGKPLPE